VRARVALRAVAFHPPVRAGVALRAVAFMPAVGAAVAHRAGLFQLPVRAGVAHHAAVELPAMMAKLPLPCHHSHSVVAVRSPSVRTTSVRARTTALGHPKDESLFRQFEGTFRCENNSQV
jgi:hypothetical protein